VFSVFRNFLRQNKWVVIGVLGAVLAFVGGGGLSVVSVPHLLTADAPYHLDYAWQIYQGKLPQFSVGPTMPADVSMHSYHLTGHHPPLYYGVIAPLVGPFIAAGSWEVATIIGRVMTLGIGVLSLLALAWTGWIVGGRYRKMLSVAAPAVAATFVPFVLVSSAIYSDGLLVLMSTLAFALSALLLYRGPRPWNIVCLAIVLLLGMATRVSFTSMFGVALVAVLSSFIIHGKGTLSKNLLRGGGYAAAMGLLMVIGIGWFYYFHNFEASGSFLTNRLNTAEHVRRYKPFLDVITSKNLWYLVPFGLFGHSLQRLEGFSLNQWLSYLVFLVGVSGSMVWFCNQKLRGFFQKANLEAMAVGTMFIAYSGLVFTQQIVYATGYGMYNPRYLLPAWVVAGVVIGMGMLIWQRRGVIAVAAMAAGWAVVINWLVYTLVTEAHFSVEQGWFHMLQSAATDNGFPAAAIPILLTIIAAGVLLVGVSLWRLSPD
jgi:hypothetical protein